VLSGYLITCTLIKQFDDGREGFFAFYWRRFLRLFPAFALVCVTLYLARGFLDSPDQPLRDILAAGLYVSNWTRAGHQSVPIYLAHTWSLSIEEQFYLIWPIVLLLLLSQSGRRGAAIGAASLATSVMLWRAAEAWLGASSSRLYNSFDLRSDGLLLGCALALYTYRNQIETLQVARISAYALILAVPAFLLIYFAFHHDDRFMFYVGYVVWNITVAGLISLLTTKTDYFSKPVLVLMPLVFIGEISYGLYLWHFPISFVLKTQYHVTQFDRMVITCVASLVLASLSFYLLERPALSLRHVRIGRPLGTLCLAMNACAMAAGIWVFWHAEIISFFIDRKAEIAAYGPTELRQGVSFNPQPDGTSAMWIKTTSDVRNDTQISIDGTALPATVSFDLVTAIVPSNLVRGLGDHVVILVGPDHSPRSNEVAVRLLPVNEH
jgi:peptidoglycan/LPS O-acetylase OafA/YrhL